MFYNHTFYILLVYSYSYNEALVVMSRTMTLSQRVSSEGFIKVEKDQDY